MGQTYHFVKLNYILNSVTNNISQNCKFEQNIIEVVNVQWSSDS